MESWFCIWDDLANPKIGLNLVPKRDRSDISVIDIKFAIYAHIKEQVNFFANWSKHRFHIYTIHHERFIAYQSNNILNN
jgi:hypothetical protein